jgi:hypothetical protein
MVVHGEIGAGGALQARDGSRGPAAHANRKVGAASISVGNGGVEPDPQVQTISRLRAGGLCSAARTISRFSG